MIYYTCLRASAGGNLDALLAGYSPKKIPVDKATTEAIIPVLA